jgi:hypothetical protein
VPDYESYTTCGQLAKIRFRATFVPLCATLAVPFADAVPL